MGSLVNARLLQLFVLTGKDPGFAGEDWQRLLLPQ
jgi:hypothetical protein